MPTKGPWSEPENRTLRRQNNVERERERDGETNAVHSTRVLMPMMRITHPNDSEKSGSEWWNPYRPAGAQGCHFTPWPTSFDLAGAPYWPITNRPSDVTDPVLLFFSLFYWMPQMLCVCMYNFSSPSGIQGHWFYRLFVLRELDFLWLSVAAGVLETLRPRTGG